MSSTVWNEGYFTDATYTYGYYREINPVFQRFCLLLRGFAAQESSTPQHCELGFGQGVSFSIHAAANPGHYVGTDFNPTHAAHANQLVQASGSGARVWDDSFEQLLERTDLPQFDSISLHGIWTWISLDNQKIVTEFARRHLKPGGYLYVSYNCFPGWSPAYPLRQLFALHDRYIPGGSDVTARVDSAMKFSQDLLAAGPAYLKAVPSLPERLKQIVKQNRHYLAHEYLNHEWNCMYFSDVVEALGPAKLDYACTAVPLDIVESVNLTAEARTFLASIAHPILREQARDYFINQQFRKDLYMRGPITLSPAQRRHQLLQTRFVLLKHAPDVPLKVNTAGGEATLQESVYRPLLDALAGQQHAPKTLRDLVAALPGLAEPQVLEALIVLVGTGVAAPCQTDAAARQVHKRCDQLNRHLMERAQYSNDIDALASPVLGGGVAVGRFHQLFLLARALGRKNPPEWAQHAWQIIESQGQRLLKDAKTLETPEENLAELNQQAADFAVKNLPVLKALQVA
ncbi:class I SAM-dependent methyltransferase [Castellaniella sp.]|uniref:class I SAM-dependent methyltransferase n=1 Tax=Castellaniella sp. TaxID=1955812 RepID=UPI002AFE4D7F|nr:class I SAM-dependent methyltransferase [Castellaniella sp.]